MIIISDELQPSADVILYSEESLQDEPDNILIATYNRNKLLTADHIQRLIQTEQEIEKRGLNTSTSFDTYTDDELAKRRHTIKTLLSQLKSKDEELRAERDAIDAELFNRFEERGTTGTRTAGFTISVSVDDNYPVLSDRTAFEDYVLETGKLHLLQKRISLSAVQEELALLRDSYEEMLNELLEDPTPEKAELLYLDWAEGEDEEVAMHRLNVLKSTSSLVEFMKETLCNAMKLPGVDISTKRVINQIKRRVKS